MTSKNLYLYVYNYIKDNSKLPDKDKLGLSKQNLQYYVSRLRKNEFIRKVGYGTWEITGKDFELNELKEVKISRLGTSSKVASFPRSKNVRAHAFQFRLKIRKIPNWNKRMEYLAKKKIDFVALKNKTQRIQIKDYKIHLGSRSIVIYAPSGKSFFAETAKQGKLAGLQECLSIIRKIERLLGNLDLRIHKKYQIKVCKQEYAEIENELAKKCNVDNDKIRISGSDGCWLLIDNSFNLNELETVHPRTSERDMDEVVKPFFNDLRENEPMTLSQVKGLIGDLVKENQETAAGLNSVVKLLRQLYNVKEERTITPMDSKIDYAG